MAIKKRPSTAAEFLAGAPDSAPSEPARERSGMKRGHRYQLSVSVTGETLDRLDALGERYGLKRSGMISLAISQMLERGPIIGSGPRDE